MDPFVAGNILFNFGPKRLGLVISTVAFITKYRLILITYTTYGGNG
jgi:hypothetical protein